MALIDEKPRNASVSAMEETTLKVFHRNEFISIINNDKHIAIKFLSGIFSRLREANAKLSHTKVNDQLKTDLHKKQSDDNISYELIIEGVTDKAIKSLPSNPFNIIVNNAKRNFFFINFDLIFFLINNFF